MASRLGMNSSFISIHRSQNAVNNFPVANKRDAGPASHVLPKVFRAIELPQLASLLHRGDHFPPLRIPKSERHRPSGQSNTAGASKFQTRRTEALPGLARVAHG